ncbi:MAG: hypothetical protein R3C20_20860 [Planctomycetaceae bacterium]
MSHPFTSRYFQGWVAYFRFRADQNVLRGPRQVDPPSHRACYWKHWRSFRTRIANLRQLGVKEDEA